MGLFRKMTSVSTFGAVDFRSDKERTARYTKQTRNAARAQRRIMKRQAKAAQLDLRYTVPPNIPMRSQLPPVPVGAPPAQWNGTVWQVWDEHQRRWLVWDGYAWR